MGGSDPGSREAGNKQGTGVKCVFPGNTPSELLPLPRP